MTESNVTPLPGRPAGKRYDVRFPKLRDAKNLIGAVASARLNDETLSLVEGGENVGAMVMAVKNALGDEQALDRMVFVLADMWEWEPEPTELDPDNPHELWEYDPPQHLVEKKSLLSREEQWRSYSARQRKRIVKKLTLEDQPGDVIGDFWESVQEMPYVKDFLERARKSAEEGSGESKTPSSGGTGDSDPAT